MARTHRAAFGGAAVSVCLALLGACASAPESLPPVSVYAASLADEPAVEGEGKEGNHGYHRAGRLYFGGQPTRDDLEALRRDGVSLVINLRSVSEVEDRERTPFDPAAAAERLGMTYVHIPMGGSDGYETEQVRAFAEALEASNGSALIHCASGGRARAVWMAYLITERGYAPAEAKAVARSLGQKPSALERLAGMEIDWTAGGPLPDEDEDKDEAAG